MPSNRTSHILQGEIKIITVQGQHGICATVLKHSISPAGINLITMEVSYPRIILAELNTHGMICKNSSSSRAIPFNKMAEQLEGRPVRFGQANPGMQDKGEDYDVDVDVSDIPYLGSGTYKPWLVWKLAKQAAVWWSHVLYKAGLHKQVYNRLTEPFQMMKTVISWTEGANFFWLRNHEAADPSLHELARVMYEAAKQSEPQLLHPGEWHLPYLCSVRNPKGEMKYFLEDILEPGVHEALTLEEAIKVSTARTAAVSFRNVDYGVEKSEEVFIKLTSDERIHGSAMAHQATPMKPRTISYGTTINVYGLPSTWEPGVSHSDRNGQLWSAQYRGWIMHRKLIEGENVPGFI